jgi:AcrR family transcriptional regulator
MQGATGLRERKKERTRQGILSAAHELFLSKCYEGTTMEGIAERAELAVGTLYNYFTSKGALLLALLADTDERYLKEGQQLVSHPAVLAEHALTDLMVLATEHCVRELGKSIWRQVSATAVTNVGSAFGRQYALTTKKHEQLVVDMMGALQARGDIHRNVDAKDAAHFLFSMKSMLFINFISDEAMTIKEHREQVQRGVRYFLAGIFSESRETDFHARREA